MDGYRFLFFPMTQFIVHPQIESKLQFDQHDQCPCKFQRIYEKDELSILSEAL